MLITACLSLLSSSLPSESNLTQVSNEYKTNARPHTVHTHTHTHTHTHLHPLKASLSSPPRKFPLHEKGGEN